MGISTIDNAIIKRAKPAKPATIPYILRTPPIIQQAIKLGNQILYISSGHSTDDFTPNIKNKIRHVKKANIKAIIPKMGN
jgi:hypothetical protein